MVSASSAVMKGNNGKCHCAIVQQQKNGAKCAIGTNGLVSLKNHPTWTGSPCHEWTIVRGHSPLQRNWSVFQPVCKGSHCGRTKD
jgi:hypothetical protein